MRQPVDPKIVSAIIKAGGNGRITLRTYAPSGSGSYSGVPVSVLKESGLASPSAREAQRQRFGRAISLNRIETALRGAHCGNMMQLTDLSRETVETDPHLGAILNKRFGALSSLPYEVRPASGYGVDKEKAQFYAAVVWEQLKNLTHFRRTLRQLAWALFDGRAAVELFWRKVVGPSHESFGTVGLAVTATGWIHPRRLSFGSQRELVCTNEYGSIGAGNFSVVGVVLDAVAPGKFITWQPQLFGEYQEREGLAPRCMYWSFFKRYSQRDRMILMELFGKPWRIVETDEDSQASSEDLEAAEEAADGLGAAYTARMPRGIKLTVVQPGRTAGQVHDKVIEDCDKQLSKLVLGQTGTTDAVPAGLNSNQASMMQDEQLMVLTADAIELSEIGENQLTDQIIAANFGYSELPHAPTFILRSDLPVNRLEEVERLTAALNAGLEVSLSEAYEISGFRQPERNEPVLKVDQPPTPSLAPTPPAARPVIVWPPNASPPTGEQQPLTPQAGTGEGAREGAGISVGSADQKTIVTVNEAREGQGLPPLVLPGGQSDPDGDLTVSEYEAKIAKRHGKPAGTGPVGQQFKKNADSIEPNLVPPPLLNSTSATIQLIVRKSGDQWCVYSEDGSRSFGCYGTREAAEERLKQVEAFKHMDEQDDVLALSATFEKLRQPETVNGSVEDVIERGKPDIQRVVNEWAEEFLSAVDKVKSIGEVTREINRVVGRLDQNAFAEAMEHALLHSAALGALDCWFDEESGTTVAPATFEVPATDPKFAKKPFADAIEYFQAKNVVTKETFERLSETAQRKAFTVAALTQQNMLGAVHVELARHVGQGADIRSFRTFLKGRLEEAGYTAASTKAEAAYVDNVFRTNTLGAYNAGRYERQTQPEVLRLRPYWQIRTVSDNRRRETHARADGLVLRADDPFWQRCYPPMGFECFLPGTEIEGRVIGASKTFYSGQVVDLFTAVGRRLTVTANHPIFTQRGLIVAKNLVQGDDLICDCREPRISTLGLASKRNDENAPILVEDIFHALSKTGVSCFSGYSPNDFHGEASRFDGDIEIVGSYRELLRCYQVAIAKKIAEFVFKNTTARTSFLMGNGFFNFSFERNSRAFSSSPSSSALPNNSGTIEFDRTPFQELRLGACSEIDTILRQNSINDLPADISFIRELFDRSTSEIRFDKLICISKRYFSGHVYDLESPLGWITANGLYTTNCRCRIVSLSAKQAENMVITDGSTIDYLPDPGFTSGVRSLMSAQWPRDPVVKIMLENSILLERDVQTLVFDKTKFETRESALAWAKEHGFKHSTLRETENSWRVRQRPPKDFKDGTMRTKQIANGVSIVDGELKE